LVRYRVIDNTNNFDVALFGLSAATDVDQDHIRGTQHEPVYANVGAVQWVSQPDYVTLVNVLLHHDWQ
jgi:hypothetical protein